MVSFVSEGAGCGDCAFTWSVDIHLFIATVLATNPNAQQARTRNRIRGSSLTISSARYTPNTAEQHAAHIIHFAAPMLSLPLSARASATSATTPHVIGLPRT